MRFRMLLLLAACHSPAKPQPTRLWDDAALADWGTPVAGLGVRPTYLSSALYYAAPVDNLRTYPVYLPSREPAGYRESLIARGPQPLIDASTLRTQQDWIDAGQRVFEELDTPGSRTDDPDVIAHFTDAAAIDRFRDATHDVIDANGVLLDYRWVVGTDGKLRLSLSSCVGCHSRLMPDGSVLAGAPGNYNLSDAPAVLKMLDQLGFKNLSAAESFYAQYGVPWLAGDPHQALRDMPDAKRDALLADVGPVPQGTMFARVNGSPLFQTRMADLRGIKNRRYLDTTGTHLHRGPEDIARYGILVEYADIGVFGKYKMLPQPPPTLAVRPPDEAMLAMALYLESLEPAPSPFPMDALARHGKDVFDDLSCADCHAPPDFTTNELVAVGKIGTDPSMTLRTRKGTGFYRIPSLRGLWYRGLYEHGGSLATLEDWFDPARLRPDYQPTAFRGPGVTHRAVPGHEFGLDLDPDDKRALIAYLRTL
ncbi:MAG TPA: hypothetical protein VL326_14395 [Kofleriaceae bacterium]|nr:hypothetical protein [Kofleriaceae bacterium]